MLKTGEQADSDRMGGTGKIMNPYYQGDGQGDGQPDSQPDPKPDILPNSESLRCDQVAVQKTYGYNLLSIKEFISLPLNEIVRLLTQGKVQFLANGKLVPTRRALRSLRSGFAVGLVRKFNRKKRPVFQQVRVRNWDQDIFLSKEEFLSLSQRDRARLILSEGTEFIDGRGARINPTFEVARKLKIKRRSLKFF